MLRTVLLTLAIVALVLSATPPDEAFDIPDNAEDVPDSASDLSAPDNASDLSAADTLDSPGNASDLDSPDNASDIETAAHFAGTAPEIEPSEIEPSPGPVTTTPN